MSSMAEDEGVPEAAEEPVVAQEAEEEDLFVTFVAIVDELLGSNLPSDVVEAFVDLKISRFTKQLEVTQCQPMMRCAVYFSA